MLKEDPLAPPATVFGSAPTTNHLWLRENTRLRPE